MEFERSGEESVRADDLNLSAVLNSHKERLENQLRMRLLG